MAEHGVIFVSITDIELGRLLMLMDEIFDETQPHRCHDMARLPDNNPSRVVIEHEYIVCYAKNIKKVAQVWTTPEDETRDRSARGVRPAEG